jgi:glycosyltransferase involved in cell wall biosynthesis
MADVFIIPSMKEGFGNVFLEAAAPVIGGRVDGSWEALREDQIGEAIDPDQPEEIVEAVCRALKTPTRPDPAPRGSCPRACGCVSSRLWSGERNLRMLTASARRMRDSVAGLGWRRMAREAIWVTVGQGTEALAGLVSLRLFTELAPPCSAQPTS